ncbi:succinylglutamate desuccinylase/aspartoacylase family protein [Porticoccus sp. W117]|uniref:succinylglutamate desuccinylase/aspartoacylase domain-containing protein n=1 Tax=Porticoccus sp. W117 TaxID=3054777 RepID=UPI002591EDEE|nr:succinylglutamate desuccinylase/aspartoacylase family protein [Porticoccus sp. W117]MDM3871701.1 succinylglutamate desuccinylase/aspartoacylase family protein [Porticoccus sp. W117]
MGQAEPLWNTWEAPAPNEIPENLEEFLCHLSGPTVISLPGADPSTTRVAVTLLHGNEPSGAKAIHRLLREGFQPATNTLLVLACIATALTEPLFSHRLLPGCRDMNRCFKPPFDDYQGQLAKSLIDTLAGLQPEAIVDLHNTSGDGPAFAVTSQFGVEHMSLANLFTSRLVYTDLSLGSLMEITEPGCPVVTIECGGARQAESDDVAYQGLQEYLLRPHLFKNAAAVQLDLYRHPMRLELKEGFQIDCSSQPTDADVTLQRGVQNLNFGEVETGQQLAWLGEQGMAALQVKDGEGGNRLDEFFEQREGMLCTRQPLKLFMVTENPHIAATDCLFYLVGVE